MHFNILKKLSGIKKYNKISSKQHYRLFNSTSTSTYLREFLHMALHRHLVSFSAVTGCYKKHDTNN